MAREDNGGSASFADRRQTDRRAEDLLKQIDDDDIDQLLTLTADIVSAHVSNNTVAVNDLPQLIANVHGALTVASGMISRVEITQQEPKVSARASVKPDYIVCMECGSKQKMLKRHLFTQHRQTPEQYRAKWNLPVSYPMVAPNYALQRRDLAISTGLGQKMRDARRKRA